MVSGNVEWALEVLIAAFRMLARLVCSELGRGTRCEQVGGLELELSLCVLLYCPDPASRIQINRNILIIPRMDGADQLREMSQGRR